MPSITRVFIYFKAGSLSSLKSPPADVRVGGVVGEDFEEPQVQK